MIWNLSASTVYHVANFIRHDELQVLGSKFISNKKSILDFDGSNHVIRHSHKHLIVLHLLLLLLHHHLLVHHLLMLHLLLLSSSCILLLLSHLSVLISCFSMS